MGATEAIWEVREFEPVLLQQVQDAFDVPEIYARVLAGRGIVDRQYGTSFFNPGRTQLHDPFLMQDMDIAVERLLQQIRSGSPMVVFGDYDVDGTTGASMMYLALKEMGAHVSYYVPNRETEGYGLSAKGIEYAGLIGADLMITCDCGINAFEQVERARRQGIDIIITDHHLPERELPAATAILNPKRPDCSYPFKGLCGGGVAFKVALAVAESGGFDPELVWQHSDLIALGTAADIVPIIDENRVIVSEGLQRMQAGHRPGLEALLRRSGLAGKEMTVGRLVFGIAPKINAAGRLGDAGRAVELLTTENKLRALSIADELFEENARRQLIQQNTVEEAIFMVNANHDLNREMALVLAGDGWHPGVIGIVAARIRDEFRRPTVIIALADGVGKGSARTLGGLDLYEALTECKDHLDGFGGHAAAAGLTINRKRLPAFTSKFLEHAARKLTLTMLQPRLRIDGELPLELINGRFMRFLNVLAPYGPGNMRPVFISRNTLVAGNPRLVGEGMDHLKFQVRRDKSLFDVIGFNMAEHYEKLLLNKPLDIAYVVEENEWQGRRKVQLLLKDLRLGDPT